MDVTLYNKLPTKTPKNKYSNTFRKNAFYLYM